MNHFGRMAMLCMVLFASVLVAAPMFLSGDGIGESFINPGYSGNGAPYSGTPVVINPGTLPGVWAVSSNGAKWVSIAQTGEGGRVLPSVQTPIQPWTFATANFYESFTAFGTDIEIRVWADDTAKVVLNGTQLGPNANFTQDGACAAGPISCQQSEGLVYRVKAADLLGGTGANRLTVSAYQTVGGPFGVMYEASAVPEPGTYAMLGLGLVGIGAWKRWRSQ